MFNWRYRLTFIGCNSAKNEEKAPEQDTISGWVGEGTSMHVLQVVLGKDTTDFFINDSCDVSNSNRVIGNLVDIIYKKGEDRNIALKITGNSTYVNALGNWTCPISGQKGVEGVNLKINGETSLFNMHTLMYKRWRLTDSENQLLLEDKSIGNRVTSQFMDTIIIKQIDQKWIMKIVGKDVDSTKIIKFNFTNEHSFK